MKNYDYYFRRSTGCGQLLALRVGPAAPHPARLSLRLSSHILVWSSLYCVAQTSTNVVVRGSVKPTCEESNLQRNLQERVSSVLFAFSRAGLCMWSAKCVQEKNSAFSAVA